MTSKDVICLNLMLIASVVLLITNESDVSVFIHSDSKDNHVTRLIIVVCGYDGTFSLKVPLIAIIHLFTMKSKCGCKFFLLSVFHFLHTVIDGKVLQSSATCGVNFFAVLLVSVILMELHWHKVDGCCHP